MWKLERFVTQLVRIYAKKCNPAFLHLSFSSHLKTFICSEAAKAFIAARAAISALAATVATAATAATAAFSAKAA